MIKNMLGTSDHTVLRTLHVCNSKNQPARQSDDYNSLYKLKEPPLHPLESGFLFIIYSMAKVGLG